MHLPFTEVEVLNLFARFNVAFWPVLLALWLASAAAAVSLASGRATARPVLILLAVHWLWSGLAFHAWFFTRINPRADLVALMFVAQGLLFVWAAGQSRIHVDWEASLRQLTGLAFVGLALAYPLLVLSGRPACGTCSASLVRPPSHGVLLTRRRLPAYLVDHRRLVAVGGSAASWA